MPSFKMALASLLLFLAVPLVAAENNGGRNPTVEIDTGKLRGKAAQHSGSGVTVNKFLGIPFAEPPVKGLRFSPPKKIESWDGTLDVQEQPDACIQYYGPKGPGRERTIKLYYDPPPLGESEDCLYLNVYVPEGGEENKAVLFWIHGGSGVNGASSLPLYDGTSFAARQDIIFVSTNYRLNVFGATGAPQIDLEDNNVWQMDVLMALDWTKRNIKAFGGDPDKVTIMGESAGAMSVGHMINTIPDDPPFRAGIQMSGSSIVAPGNLESAAQEGNQWPKLTKLMNCTNTNPEKELKCMRDADAKTIQHTMESNKLPVLGNRPDNKTIHERPDVVWANGQVAKVPIMIGSTADDASYFARRILEDTPSAGNLSISTILTEGLGLSEREAEVVGDLYSPGAPFAEGANTTEEILSRIGTDLTFRCSSNFVANLTSSALDVSVWQYVFDAIVPSNTWEEYPYLGAYHAGELEVLFETFPKKGSNNVEAALSQSIQKQFADFIKDPEKGPGWKAWPKVGVLSVDSKGAVTKSEPAAELDAVCQLYYPGYLESLPALERVSRDDTGSNDSDDDAEDDRGDTVNVGSSTRLGFVGMIAIALGLAVLL